ncbi:MAG TPA: hypothetical protein DD624_03295 [Alphaproteobacteria bacterium]|nr:hypothetical protein [Alphaproteobacteria bacterium]
MFIWLKKFKPNLLFGCLFAFFMLLPDFVMEQVRTFVHYNFDAAFVFALIVFGFFLSLGGKTLFCLVMLSLLVMQLIQVNHIAYFGQPINPTDISKVYKEFGEVVETGKASLRSVGFVTPMLLACFGALFFVFFKYRRLWGFSWLAVLAVVVALGVKPERAARKSLKHFLPAEPRYSLHNSLNAFSYFIVKERLTDNVEDMIPAGFYKPYTVSETGRETPRLVFLIMGESTASDEMHVLGGKEKTTPKLDELVENPKFQAFRAYAGAVSTHAALPIFFNVMREPGNLAPIKDKTANLFRLAKQSGYATHFLSVQDAKQTHEIGMHFIDDVVTTENIDDSCLIKHEDCLLDLLKQRDMTQGKHFVVLNFRNTHSPYEKNYSHRKGEFSVFPTTSKKRTKYQQNTYRNAMLYLDSVTADLFGYFKSLDGGKGVFAMTSDHGQLLGQNGLFGHNIVRLDVAAVPFLFYSDALPPLERKAWTHYEIGKLFVSLFGYDLNNPNEQANSFFIHGNNLYEEYAFLNILRQPDGTMKAGDIQFLKQYFQGNQK